MKGKMMNIVLTVAVLVAFGAASYSGFTFYQEYKAKMASVDEQNKYIKSQLDDFSKNIVELKDTLGSLNGRIAKSSDMESISTRLASGESELKNATSQIDEIRNEIKSWQESYSGRLEELQAKVTELKSSLEARGKTTIDLGRVAIEKENNAVAASSAQPEVQPTQESDINKGVVLQPR